MSGPRRKCQQQRHSAGSPRLPRRVLRDLRRQRGERVAEGRDGGGRGEAGAVSTVGHLIYIKARQSILLRYSDEESLREFKNMRQTNLTNI